ncbi:hypothetical protein [Dethiothermospora halolimnae]|uniref:hypothetical protein n=1 Tax=Dethiothermospora halolimnae TaxID=3114390 RepID=UPI003CCBE5AD
MRLHFCILAKEGGIISNSIINFKERKEAILERRHFIENYKKEKSKIEIKKELMPLVLESLKSEIETLKQTYVDLEDDQFHLNKDFSKDDVLKSIIEDIDFYKTTLQNLSTLYEDTTKDSYIIMLDFDGLEKFSMAVDPIYLQEYIFDSNDEKAESKLIENYNDLSDFFNLINDLYWQRLKVINPKIKRK